MEDYINKYYNILLKRFAKDLFYIFDNDNCYGKVNEEEYIHMNILKEFKYIKDLFPYYYKYDSGSETYMDFECFFKSHIYLFILNQINNENIKTRNKIENIIFERIKNEKINELIILYKLERKI